MLLGGQYSPQATDIYSLGVTLFNIMFLTMPFDDFDIDEFNRNYNNPDLIQKFFNFHYSKLGLYNEPHTIEALILVFRCLNPDPTQRPSWEEIMSNQWISSVRSLNP